MISPPPKVMDFGYIHVDRYKQLIYHHVSSRIRPLSLSHYYTRPLIDTFSCMRTFSFVAVDNDSSHSAYPKTNHMGKRVVYINPVKMESEKWDPHQKDTKSHLVAGEEINNLVSSLSLTQSFGLSAFLTARTAFSTFHSSRTRVILQNFDVNEWYPTLLTPDSMASTGRASIGCSLIVFIHRRKPSHQVRNCVSESLVMIDLC
jgi:hypothetical protein